MPYAQINYQQKLGTGPKALTIHDAGCFLTAFCNLAERFGQPVDPPTLDQYFIQHNDFIRESDGTDDLLSWGSITAFNPNFRVASSGSGAPASDNSIVKFIYGAAKTTHFCLVVNAAEHLILDSWDGKVKNWSVYGGPVAYASYTNATPSPATTAKPQIIPAGKKLFLPSSAGLWNVYNVGGPWTIGHQIGRLAPGNFPPGLTYDILAHIAPNIVKIHTDTFGDVAIYVGTDTPAQFVDAAPAPPVNYVYTKLPQPLDLVTNKQPTQWWNLNFQDDVHATPAATLDKGVPFRAFGKAQRTDGDRPCYFMTEFDFAQADVTGHPLNKNGINTVDLSPPPAPEPQTPPPAPEAAPAAPETPAPAESEEVKVPVTVKSWQDSFKEQFGVYRANSDITVHDLEGKLPDQELGHDVRVTVAGTFVKDGQTYYRTVKSQNEHHWYGIPQTALVQVADTSGSKIVDAIIHPSKTAHTVVDDIDKIAADLEEDPEFNQFKSTLTPRGKLVADIAEAEDKVSGFIHKVNLFKKQNK